MSFFGNNQNAIINNLFILNKQYYVVVYLETTTLIDSLTNVIFIDIKLKGNCINLDSKTSSASASINGTANTFVSISNFYVSLLNDGVNLLYSAFSLIEGFSNCNNITSFTTYNAINNINQISTNIMKFKFDILNLKIERQGGQTIDAFIEYQYINYYTSFNYINLRDYVIQVLENDTDINSYWEYICIFIAHNALQKFKDIIGIKINLVVLSNPYGEISEPGDHGPTYTYGLFI
jgi:hypothetical protein